MPAGARRTTRREVNTAEQGSRLLILTRNKSLDPAFGAVSLLLPFTGTNGATSTLDISSKVNALTFNGNAQISTAQSVFGGSSLLLDGNNDYLTANNASLALGSGDFAIQYHIRRIGDGGAGSGASQSLLDWRTAEPSDQVYMSIDASVSGSTLRVYINGANRISGPAIALNQWYYLALRRTSGVLSLEVDGTQQGTYSSSSNYSATALTIGGRFAAVSGDFRGFNGYIDNLRMTVGNARSATVPTAAWPFN